MKYLILIITILFAFEAKPQDSNGPTFPVEPILFVSDTFRVSEGIAFNGIGDMYVTADEALWKIMPSGQVNKITDLYSNLGVAGFGSRDLLVADFGPTNAFRQNRNNDGIVWLITPDGKKEKYVTGIGDPNFLLVMPDTSVLVSDDATNEIFRIDKNRNLDLFCTAVNHPNGLAISLDGKTLYVAQIFENIRPVIADNRVWSVKLKNGKPVRGAKVIVRSGPNGANDGLAMDKYGRLYIAAHAEGKILRYDPETEQTIVIAEDVWGAASMAFGEGQFDHKAIYITTTYSGGRGGKIWKVDVGIEGTSLYR